MNRWKLTLNLGDVFHNEAMTFPEKRDAMVPRIRALAPDDDELQMIADELADTEDGDERDAPWSVFYDWADANRVWVHTWPQRVSS